MSCAPVCPRSSSAVTAMTSGRSRSAALKRHAAAIDAAKGPFISAEPRPSSRPSATVGLNGSQPASPGTVSEWLNRPSPPFPSPFLATRLTFSTSKASM